MNTGEIDHLYTWLISDEVLYISCRGGQRRFRIFRALFVGHSVVEAIAILVAAGMALLYLSSEVDLRLVFGAVFFAILLGIALGAYRDEMTKPFRVTISALGIEVRTLLDRRLFPMAEINGVKVVRYSTHSRVPAGGSKLVAVLTSGENAVLVDAKQTDASAEMKPVLEFFTRIRHSGEQNASDSHDTHH